MVIEIIADIIDSLLGAWFVSTICSKKGKKDWSWLAFFMLNSVLTSVASVFSSFSPVMTILFAISLFAQAFHYKNINIGKRILTPALFMVVIILTSSFMSYLWAVLEDGNIDDILAYGLKLRALLLLSHKMVLIVALLALLPICKNNLPIERKNLFLYLLSPIFTTIILFLLIAIDFEFQLEKYYAVILLSVIGLFAVNLISLLSFMRATEHAHLQHELNLLSQRTEIEQNTYLEMKNLYEKLQHARHDFKEQLAYLKTLSASGDSEISKYIEDLEHQLATEKRFVQTENRAIDFVLCSKAEDHPDITFLASGTLADVKSLSQLELVTLLGNMLQNAIEAVETQENKQIEILFQTQGHYQNITCKNPIQQSVLNNNSALKSTKPKGTHGFGVKSMRSTVEHVGGLIEFYEENGMFIVHCAVPIAADQ